MARVPMTRTGYEKLVAELKEFETGIPPLKKAIMTAREHGDLSENAEYHAAKEALIHLENKIAQLQMKISAADIIDNSRIPPGVVSIGATVTLLDMDADEEEEYALVGAGEENFLEGRILTTSPLAQAMIGKKDGDEFEFETPNGMVLRYRILKVERS